MFRLKFWQSIWVCVGEGVLGIGFAKTVIFEYFEKIFTFNFIYQSQKREMFYLKFDFADVYGGDNIPELRVNKFRVNLSNNWNLRFQTIRKIWEQGIQRVFWSIVQEKLPPVH